MYDGQKDTSISMSPNVGDNNSTMILRSCLKCFGVIVFKVNKEQTNGECYTILTFCLQKQAFKKVTKFQRSE